MKYNIEIVKKIFKDNHCELLENEYINNHTKMKYTCSCKNTSEIQLKCFIKGIRCMKCKGNEKYNYIDVKNYFNNILLDKNLKKREATLKAGYNFEFWICNSKQLVEII
jgi:hypothetical protein